MKYYSKLIFVPKKKFLILIIDPSHSSNEQRLTRHKDAALLSMLSLKIPS